MKRIGWGAARIKVEQLDKCRVCARSTGTLAAQGLRLEACHLAPRQHDELAEVDGEKVRLVDVDNIIGLCGPATASLTCHGRFDAGVLDLLPYLTKDEQAACVKRIGLMSAMRRLVGE